MGERKVAAIWWLSLSKEWERARAHRKNLHFMAFLLKRLNRLSKVPTSSVYTRKSSSYSSRRLPHEFFLKVNLCGSNNEYGEEIFLWLWFYCCRLMFKTSFVIAMTWIGRKQEKGFRLSVNLRISPQGTIMKFCVNFPHSSKTFIAFLSVDVVFPLSLAIFNCDNQH